MEIKKYRKFNEDSTSKANIIDKARELVSNSFLKSVLLDCINGKLPSVQVTFSESVKSYVAVSINVEKLFSEVYYTEDPKVALVAMIIEDTGKELPEEIANVLTTNNNGHLRYTVFPGTRKMSPREIANKYNFKYDISPGDAVPFYTSTPIKKSYF